MDLLNNLVQIGLLSILSFVAIRHSDATNYLQKWWTKYVIGGIVIALVALVVYAYGWPAKENFCTEDWLRKYATEITTAVTGFIGLALFILAAYQDRTFLRDYARDIEYNPARRFAAAREALLQEERQHFNERYLTDEERQALRVLRGEAQPENPAVGAAAVGVNDGDALGGAALGDALGGALGGDDDFADFFADQADQ